MNKRNTISSKSNLYQNELKQFKSKITATKNQENATLYNEIVRWLKQLPDKNNIINYSIDITRAYIKNKQLQPADTIFQKLIHQLKIADKRKYLDVVSAHIDFLQKNDEYKSAVEYYLEYDVIKNEIRNLDKEIEVNKLRQKYKDAEQQMDIERLNHQKELQKKLVAQAADIDKTNKELIQINKELFDVHYDLMETKILRSQMNPHFVYNTLNSISSLIKSRRNTEAISYLQKFSKLTRQIFEKNSRKDVSLKDEIDFCLQYISLEKLRFGDKFNFELALDDTININKQMIPSMILQPLLENAVKHGIFHNEADKGGILRLSIKNNVKSVAIKIEDNGSGFNKNIDEVFSNERESSLIIVNKRINIYNKDKLTAMSMIINSNKKKGTTLRFKLKK